MKRMKTLLSILMVLILLASCAELRTQREEKILQRLALEIKHDPREALVRHPFGTGFIWEGFYVVTAAHALPEDIKTLRVQVNQFSPIECYAQFKEIRGDMAIFRIENREEPFHSLPITENNAQPMQKTYIVGWRKVIPCRNFIPGMAMITGKKDLLEGDSGAPVLAATGEVLGIVTAEIKSGADRFLLYEHFHSQSPYSGPSRLKPVKGG